MTQDSLYLRQISLFTLCNSMMTLSRTDGAQPLYKPDSDNIYKIFVK